MKVASDWLARSMDMLRGGSAKKAESTTNRSMDQRASLRRGQEALPPRMLRRLMDDLQAVGFELSSLGNNTFSICGVPAEIDQINPIELIRNIVIRSIETGSDVKQEIQESVALSIASSGAIAYGQKLSDEEMTQLVNQLFATPTPNHTPDGRTVISILKDGDIAKLFK